ncbi:hypothetical protein [Neobacillus soli]|uniref:hypothetical protein n=1 Tax=Neobacillus soli TaxID=220688 RepID=UPI000826531F|nr:hypothetical protein [Neobacillus soli]
MKYISGGYYIVSSIKRPEYMDKDLIPDTIYSASECLCDFHPEINILWGGSKRSKKDYAQKLNINESTFNEVEKRVEEMFEAEKFTYPQVFTTVELAKEFFCKFLKHLTNAKVIGIGLPKKLVNEFIEYEETEKKTEKEKYGIEKLFLNKTQIDVKGAKMLGYEVIGFEYGTFHSYLCNGLEKDFKKHFGFTLNENGFIPSLEEAIRFCDYSNDEELGTEPVLWLPWAIFEYK